MNKSLILSILFLTNGAFAAWEKVEAFSEKIELRSVFFIDSLNGWVGGRIDTNIATFRAYLAHSEDGGRTWVEVRTGQSLQIIGAMCFLDHSNGFITGIDYMTKGMILKTTNGGADWSSLLSDSSILGSDNITFPSAHAGYICSYDSRNFGRTTDGGVTWELTRSDDGYPEDLFFINKDTGWAAGEYPGDKGFISKTTDGGKTWERLVPSDNKKLPHLRAVFFTDKNRGWVGGRDGTIAATTDGGKTWDIQLDSIKTSTSISGLSFANSTSGWAIDWSGTTFFTQNGETWQESPIGTANGLLNIHFSDPNHGWIAGQKGTLFRTSDNGGHPIAVQHTFNPISPSRLSIKSYAAPQAGTTGLRYTLDAGGVVEVNIYDLAGKRIASPVNGWHNVGTYSTLFRVAAGACLAQLTVRRDGVAHSVVERVVAQGAGR